MVVAQLRLFANWARALLLTEDSPSRDEIPDFAHISSLRADSFSRQKKVAPASGEKLGPRRRSDTDRLNTIDEVACCACVFHSTPQLASPRKGLRAGALYYPFFKGHLNRINRSCAVASSASDQDLAKSDHLLPRRKRAESHRNKTIAGLVS